jgi:hypothetical protein
MNIGHLKNSKCSECNKLEIYFGLINKITPSAYSTIDHHLSPKYI